MAIHRIKGFLSTLLILLICAAMAPKAFAAEEGTGEEVFSVSLPTSLPITMDSTHTIYTSTAYITNNSASPVEVTGIEVVESNGWRLCQYSTDFRTRPVGVKEFGMSIQGYNVSTSGYCDVSGFSVIAAGASEALIYDAVVAAQSDVIQEVVASVVFTVTWAAVDTPTEASAFGLPNEAETMVNETPGSAETIEPPVVEVDEPSTPEADPSSEYPAEGEVEEETVLPDDVSETQKAGTQLDPTEGGSTGESSENEGQTESGLENEAQPESGVEESTKNEDETGIVQLPENGNE